ncbi:MAG: site-specific integrase [Clostridiales bacterium]|jgi:integrase|nr:site-specific integrase [Clostridiales bacterium]
MNAKQEAKEVERLADIYEEEAKIGDHVDDGLSFEAFTTRWLKEHGEKNLERKTLSSYKAELESKILPALGKIKLRDLKRMHFIQFYGQLTEDGARADGKPGGYSTRTIKYQHQIINSILQTAVYWQVLNENPARSVKPPKGYAQSKKVNFFDSYQLNAFLDYIDENCDLLYRAFACTAVYSGMRLAELLALQWADVNFNSHSISINKALTYVDNEQYIKPTTKNAESSAIIPISAEVITLLAELKRETKGVLTDRIFNFHYTTPLHWIHKQIRRYNETHADKLPDISFHGLRHTAATLLIAAGADIRHVAAQLRHAAVSTTLDMYAGVIPAVQREAVNNFAAYVKGSKKRGQSNTADPE